MVTLRQSVVICLLAVTLFPGCGNKKDDTSAERLKSMAGGTLKAVVPVSGTILVDGAPTAGVNLYLYKEEGGAPLKECRTDEDGKYCWSTHLQCDGLEPGTYRLGFAHIPILRKNGTGDDLFKGKHNNPTKSEFKLVVEEGNPQEDVEYELKK